MEKNKINVGNILKKYTMLLALIAVMIVFEVLMNIMDKGSLFHPANVSNLIGQNGYVIVLATGMLLCILTGGNIDLSVGSTITLIGALAGKLIITYKVNIYVAMGICLLAGVLIGAFQGALIAYLRIPAFIVTLAGMLIFKGIAWVILKGVTLGPFPEEYKKWLNSFIPSTNWLGLDSKVKALVYIIALVIGAAACLAIIAAQVFANIKRKRAGQKDLPWQKWLTAGVTAALCTAVMTLAWRLGSIPVIQGEIIATNLQVKAYVLSVSMVIGFVVCVVIAAVKALTMISRSRKGYDDEAPWQKWLGIGLTVAACVVIMLLFWRLGLNKGMPVVLIWIAVVVMIYSYFTSKTVPGRHFYAMGGNEKAAKLSGVNTDRVLFGAYTNMGFLSAIAAFMCVARFNSAAPSAGDGFEMDAIAACYIGGASAYGGTGTVFGAVIGAVFMGVMNNGMSILGLPSDLQRVVKGAVLLIAVIFDVLSRRSKRV